MFHRDKEEKALLHAEIERLKKANWKLEDENMRLRENKETAVRYRMEYEKLAGNMRNLKSRYEKCIRTAEKMEKNYRKEYQRLAGKAGKAGRQG